MLKEILAITGKPGLYKIVSHSGKTLIVEDLVNGKRFPVSTRDRVVSLGDIAMYTESEDKPLGEILDILYAKENGQKLDIKAITAKPGLKSQFELYVPDFDKERVHDSDVKKLFTWYNLLVDKGYNKFAEEEPEGNDNLGTKQESTNPDQEKDSEKEK